MKSTFKKGRRNFYPTWQEASKAAIALGITGKEDYDKNKYRDLRLHSSPYVYYKDFPGMEKFLNSGYYPTWQEASRVAISLGIRGKIEYDQKNYLDPKLPSNPYVIYKDFPGMSIFLGKIYQTWQEASHAAIELGVVDELGYQRARKTDSKLSYNPGKSYKDFPGFDVFFGLVKAA